MTLTRHTCAIDHLLEVIDVLTAVAALRRDTGASLLIVITCLLSLTLSVIC